LQAALDALNQAINLHKSSTTDHEDMRTVISNLQIAVNNEAQTQGILDRIDDLEKCCSELEEHQGLTLLEINSNVINITDKHHTSISTGGFIPSN